MSPKSYRSNALLGRRPSARARRAASGHPPWLELRFYEHVSARRPPLARSQQAFDFIWPRIAGGCHTSRETRSAIERAGFIIERCDEFVFRPFPLALPTAPHILGTARRPDD